jgi:hypothetical protein
LGCCSYVPNPVLVIIDVEPKELGIPTKAYYAVEEVKEVGLKCPLSFFEILYFWFYLYCVLSQ